MADQITQLYDIKLAGASELLGNMESVNRSFAEAKKNFLALKEVIGRGGLTGGDLIAAKNQLEALRVEMARLKVQQQEGKNETLAYNNALSAQKLASKQAADGNKYVEGSVNSLRARLKELRADFNSKVNVQILSEAEIQRELAGIRQIEDRLRLVSRNQNSEGTNVGEYTRGILNAFKQNGLDTLIKSQIDKTKSQIQTLDSVFEGLKAELSSLRVTGTGSLESIETKLVENRTEAERLRQQLATVETELKGMGGVGTQVVNGFKESFKEFRGQLAQFVVGYLGFQAAISGVHHFIDLNKNLSDSFVDLKTYIKGTDDEVHKITDSLRNLDSRRGIEGLQDIAATVAQKGVDKDNIVGSTEAFDQYFTALQKGGQSPDVHEGVLTIAKLISIFNDDHQVTPNRIRELGNAILSLRNSGPVSNEFLQGYAERVGAVRSITGATIPQILGFGAAFQQLGQSEEVAGSATSILLTKLIGNIDKFAAVAGIVPDKLRAIIKVNPFEGLLTVAEKLKEKGTEGPEALVKLVGELGVSAVRARGAFSELINNGELFRAKMAAAGVAIGDTTGLLAQFEAKKDDFAGTAARIGNEFDKAFSNPNLQKGLLAITQLLLGIVKVIVSIPFGVVVTGLAAGAAAWAYYKGNVISAAIAQAYNNDQTVLGTVRKLAERLGILSTTAAVEGQTLAEQSLAVAKLRLLAATEALAVATTQAEIATAQLAVGEAELAVSTAEATIAMEGLNTATKFSPLGLILAALALIIPAMQAFGSSTAKTEKQQNILNETVTEGAKAVADQTTKVKIYTSTLNDSNVSEGTRKKALSELIALSPNYLSGLTLENIATEKGREILDRYNQSLQRSGELKAAQSIQDRAARANTAANQALQELEIAQKTGNFSGLSDEAQGLLNNAVNKGIGTFGGLKQDNLIKAAIAEAKNKITETQKSLDDTVKNLDEHTKQAQQADLADQNALISTQIFSLNGQIAAGKKANQDVSGLVSQRDDLMKKLKTINSGGENEGVTNIGGRTIDQIKADLKLAIQGFDSSVGEEKEAFKEKIDALNAELIAAGGKKAPKVAGSKNSPSDKKEKDRDEALKQADELFNIQKNDLQRRNLSELNYAIALNVLTKKFADQKLEIVRNALNTEKDLKLAQQNDLKLKQSEFLLDKYNSDKETAKKLFDLQSKQLETDFNNSKSDASDINTAAQNNPNITAESKARAQVDYDNKLISLEIGFIAQMDELEGRYKQKSVANEIARQEELKKMVQQAADDAKKINEGSIKDIQEDGLKRIAVDEKIINDHRQNILDSKKSDQKKQAALAEQDRLSDIIRLKNQIQTDRNLLATDKLTAQQRLEIQADFIEKRKELFDKIGTNVKNGGADIKATDVGSALSKGVRSLFSFNTVNDDDSPDVKDQKIAQQKLFADTVQQTYQFAGVAMDAYFDGERQAIENSLKLQERQLDSQKKVALGHAQSAAEQDTIDREFEAKKIAAEKAAFERNKKMQVAQAEVNLAIQLSNLGVLAFSPNPLNIATLGAAGAIMYGIQAALAVGAFALNISKINAAQFAGGGLADVGNGRITTAPNIPTQPNGDNIFATVKTGEVILNEKQQKMLGGANTFASIGVPGFAGGGKLGGFVPGFDDGGYTRLQPPVFRAYYQDPSYQQASNAADADSQMQELRGMIRDVASAVYATDAKKTYVVSKEMTNQQRTDKKNSSIGTL